MPPAGGGPVAIIKNAGFLAGRVEVKIVCVGGGPAGLSFATLMKMRDQAHEITVLERNPAGSTYGWGITYWQPLLDKPRRYRSAPGG